MGANRHAVEYVSLTVEESEIYPDTCRPIVVELARWCASFSSPPPIDSIPSTFSN